MAGRNPAARPAHPPKGTVVLGPHAPAPRMNGSHFRSARGVWGARRGREGERQSPGVTGQEAAGRSRAPCAACGPGPGTCAATCFLRARPPAPRTSCPASSPPWRLSEPKRWRTSPTTSRCPFFSAAARPAGDPAWELQSGPPGRKGGKWAVPLVSCQYPRASLSSRGPHPRLEAPASLVRSPLSLRGVLTSVCQEVAPGACRRHRVGSGPPWEPSQGVGLFFPTERPRQRIQHAQGWHRARTHKQRRCWVGTPRAGRGPSLARSLHQGCPDGRRDPLSAASTQRPDPQGESQSWQPPFHWADPWCCTCPKGVRRGESWEVT